MCSAKMHGGHHLRLPAYLVTSLDPPAPRSLTLRPCHRHRLGVVVLTPAHRHCGPPMQAQEQLLKIKWPTALLEHPSGSAVYTGSVINSVASSPTSGALIMAGLRVRMGINTGAGRGRGGDGGGRRGYAVDKGHSHCCVPVRGLPHVPAGAAWCIAVRVILRAGGRPTPWPANLACHQASIVGTVALAVQKGQGR